MECVGRSSFPAVHDVCIGLIKPDLSKFNKNIYKIFPIIFSDLYFQFCCLYSKVKSETPLAIYAISDTVLAVLNL